MTSQRTPPEICPVCGEEVPQRAKCCPGCGADEKTGWDEEGTRYDGLDLPDEESVRRPPKAGRSWLWSAVALALLVLLVGALVFRR